MAHEFDIGAVIKTTLDKLLETDISLILCTDSKSLYDCLVKLETTQKKRLMIDVMSLRQSYERREVTEVKWIHGHNNRSCRHRTGSKPATRRINEGTEFTDHANKVRKDWTGRLSSQTAGSISDVASVSVRLAQTDSEACYHVLY